MENSNQVKVFNQEFLAYLKTFVKKGEWGKFKEEVRKRWEKAKEKGIVAVLLFFLLFPLTIEAKTRIVITIKETRSVVSDSPVIPVGSGRRPASGLLTPYPKYLTNEGVKTREKVLAHLSKYYSGEQLTAADNILKKESGYRYGAVNSSGAGGIPQALPYSKMGCPLTEEAIICQIQWFIGYINKRYSTPLNAWRFHEVNNWY